MTTDVSTVVNATRALLEANAEGCLMHALFGLSYACNMDATRELLYQRNQPIATAMRDVAAGIATAETNGTLWECYVSVMARFPLGEEEEEAEVLEYSDFPAKILERVTRGFADARKDHTVLYVIHLLSCLFDMPESTTITNADELMRAAIRDIARGAIDASRDDKLAMYQMVIERTFDDLYL